MPPVSVTPSASQADIEPGSAWTRRIRFSHLRVLLAIARHGSLTAAAEVLGVSQPAVSQWLADIEAAAGVPLFVRGRRLRPTPFAAPILRHAEQVLGSAQRAMDEVAALRQGGLGVVRVGVMMVAAVRVMPDTLRGLRAERQAIRVTVVEDIAAGLWARFERNEVDLVIGRLPEQALRSGHPHEHLFDDPHSVVCGPGHPLVGKPKLTWRAAAAFPWIVPVPDTPLRSAIDSTFARYGIAAQTVLLESVSVMTNMILLSAEPCLAVMSRSVARHHQERNLLAMLPLELSNDTGPIGMIWRADDANPALPRVIDAVRRAATQIQGGESG